MGWNSARATVAALAVGTAVVLSTPAAAEGEPPAFHPYTTLHPGSSPANVAIGDVTGDGRPDVLLTTDYDFEPATDFSLWVYAQQDDGTLAAPVQLATSGTYWSHMAVAVADLDGDGDLDAAVTTKAGVDIFTQGPAGLAFEWTVPVAEAHHLEVADVNGDGLGDLVINAQAGIQVWRQIQGDFMPYDVGSLPTTFQTEIEVGDVTGDGLVDLVSTKGATFEVRAQTAAHAFAPPVSYPSGGLNGWDRINGLAIGDTNGDGLGDVTASIGGNKPNAWVATRAQLPDGTLGEPAVRASYDIPETIDVTDVTNDGRNDIVVLHGGWNRVGVYTQQPDGASFAGEDLYTIPYASHYDAKALAVGDVSGDGMVDLAIADYNHGLVLLRGAGVGDDITAPDTTVTSGPSGTHRSRTATFGFGSSEAGSTFSCSLDSTTSFSPCTSPITYSGLTAGAHTFRVRATDAAGNTDATPAQRTIVVDGPDTTITSGPTGTVRSRSATFEFASTPSATGFECSLDNAAWAVCASPATYNGLATGTTHTFRVRGINAEGLVDSSPATRTFTVDAAADVAVSLTDAPDPVRRGGTLTYTARVTNAGPNAAAAVVLAQGLPSGTSFASAAATVGTCTAAGAPATVRCELGTLAPGATVTVTINATVTASKGTLSSTAIVTTSTWDLALGNDSSSASTKVGNGR